MKAVFDDDATLFQHAFRRHDIEQALEAFLESDELFHLQVAGSHL